MKSTLSIFLTAAITCTMAPAFALTALTDLQANSIIAQDTIKKKASSRSNVHIVNDGKEKGNHIYINTDEGKRVELTYKGKIALTDNGEDIKSISPGGYLTYVQTINDATRRLELKSDATGTISRSYSVNGKETAYEPEGRKWMQEILPELMATTGIGVEEKVKSLYSKSGVKGVLAEAKKIDSEYGKNSYVNLLLEQPNLKSSDVKAILEFTTANVDSDYERSKNLRKMDDAHLNNKEVVTAYLDLTNSFSSDYERGKALTYLIEHADMSGDNLVKVVASTGKMSSDYEKEKVLRKLVKQPNFLKGSYTGALQLINNFSSDYEKSKAIKYLLDNQKLTTIHYQELLPVVGKISSDYEKSKVLRSIAPQIPANATALREQYIKTAQTIGSEYETKKAMDALASSN